MEENYKPVNVRLPLDIYESLRATATEQARSVSGQVLFFIKQGLKPKPATKGVGDLPFE